MNLPVTALPYIPSVFSPGDRLDFVGDFQTRDDKGRWTCDRPECMHVFTDSDVRRLYTDTESLTRLGLPLLSPAFVPEDKPLPGRPVAVGEAPFERDRPYLTISNLIGGNFHPVTEMKSGPWGVAQGACTFDGTRRPVEYEMTLTATGVVWARGRSLFGGALVTSAFIPAELPSGDDVVNLLAVAVIRAAFPFEDYCPRLSRHTL
ncbi:hypothetical protein ABT169_17465 [Streptomyces sp. NPDC001616]|uniref:hypothetical protein n=1 Tax=Streptomyces sp. NPDC001616 TaxID=3156648 RepID=UPI00331F2635